MYFQKASFAWSEGGEEGGGVGIGGGNGPGTGGAGSAGTGTASGGGGGLAHWVSVMAEHIHNPHTAGGVGNVHHQQQSPPQPPYPWNNGLSSDVSIYFILIKKKKTKAKKGTYFTFTVTLAHELRKKRRPNRPREKTVVMKKKNAIKIKRSSKRRGAEGGLGDESWNSCRRFRWHRTRKYAEKKGNGERNGLSVVS